MGLNLFGRRGTDTDPVISIPATLQPAAKIGGQEASLAPPGKSGLIKSVSQLPIGYRCLSSKNSDQPGVPLPADLFAEVAVIAFPTPAFGTGALTGPERVLRLSVPGWADAATNNITIGMGISANVTKLGLPTPKLMDATREVIAELNGVDLAAYQVNKAAPRGETAQRRTNEESKISSNPYYKIFYEILRQAVAYNTADVHLYVRYGVEPGSSVNGTRIRFRIDGDMVEMNNSFPAEMLDPAKLRSAAGFAYNELCDGKSDQQFAPSKFISAQLKDRMVGGTLIRGRYQTFDTAGANAPNGDAPFNLVLRIIYAERADIPTLEKLGFLSWQVRALRRYIDSQKGMACVSGKVGSGKSTTLRSLYAMLPSYWTKYAAEDPVENFHPNTVQINLTGSNGIEMVLKSLKRGDLNSLLMGEVRNKDTMALVRNITFSGHPCFTTTHSESALGQIPYFLTPEMEMNNHELSNPAMIGVLFHQSLTRRLCVCAIEGSEAHNILGVDRIRKLDKDFRVPIDKLRVRNPKGCEKCNTGLPERVGYAGMDVLAEMFMPDLDDLRLIERNELIDLNQRWLRSHAPYHDEDCTGKPLMAVGIYKAAVLGTLDIRSVEKSTQPIVDATTYPLAERSSSRGPADDAGGI